MRLALAVDVARPRHAPAPHVLHVGELELDVDAHRVFWGGVEAQMSPRNFSVLYYLMVAHPRVVSMQELAGEFGSDEDAGDRGERVRASLARVRQVLAEAHPRGRQPLETVHRLGYRLSEFAGHISARQ